MKNNFLAACLAVLAVLAGCAGTPQQQVQLQGSATATEAYSVATLSTNACEEALAPVQTRAIVAARQALKAHREGRMTYMQRLRAADLAETVLIATRNACPAGKPVPAEIDKAERAIREFDALLDGVKHAH